MNQFDILYSRRFFIFLAALWVSQITLGQGEPQASQAIDWKDVSIKLSVAIIAVIIGFLFNFYLTRRKEKNENKQLSYEIQINDAITKNEIPIKDKIKINYNGNHLENLSFVSIVIQNTGKVLIKDETLRFEFPSNSRILEQYFDPKPEEELGVNEETVDGDRFNFERKIKISHLTKEKNVKIHFVITGDNVLPTIHSFNPDGDVAFNERSINVKLNDQDIVRQFFLLNFYFICCVIPLGHIFKAINFNFLSELGTAIILGLWSILNFRYVVPISRIFAELLFRRKPSEDLMPEIRVVGNSNMIVHHSQGGIFDINSKSNKKGKKDEDESE